jgi:hypothetical protein
LTGTDPEAVVACVRMLVLPMSAFSRGRGRSPPPPRLEKLPSVRILNEYRPEDRPPRFEFTRQGKVFTHQGKPMQHTLNAAAFSLESPTDRLDVGLALFQGFAMRMDRVIA